MGANTIVCNSTAEGLSKTVEAATYFTKHAKGVLRQAERSGFAPTSQSLCANFPIALVFFFVPLCHSHRKQVKDGLEHDMPGLTSGRIPAAPATPFTTGE